MAIPGIQRGANPQVVHLTESQIADKKASAIALAIISIVANILIMPPNISPLITIVIIASTISYIHRISRVVIVNIPAPPRRSGLSVWIWPEEPAPIIVARPRYYGWFGSGRPSSRAPVGTGQRSAPSHSGWFDSARAPVGTGQRSVPARVAFRAPAAPRANTATVIRPSARASVGTGQRAARRTSHGSSVFARSVLADLTSGTIRHESGARAPVGRR